MKKKRKGNCEFKRMKKRRGMIPLSLLFTGASVPSVVNLKLSDGVKNIAFSFACIRVHSRAFACIRGSFSYRVPPVQEPGLPVFAKNSRIFDNLNTICENAIYSCRPVPSPEPRHDPAPTSGLPCPRDLLLPGNGRSSRRTGARPGTRSRPRPRGRGRSLLPGRAGRTRRSPLRARRR